MKGRLKTVYEAVIDTDLVSAKDFKKLYEAHLAALDKIETMEVSAKNIEQLVIDNVALTEQNKNIESGYAIISNHNERLKEDLAAAKSRIADLENIDQTVFSKHIITTGQNPKFAV